MKLKALLLVAFAAAGVGTSIAVADPGKGHDQGKDRGCRALHISGTIAPQTFVITVAHSVENGPAAGSTVTVTIGGTGQTVRANVGGCTSSAGTTTTTTSSSLSVRSVDLRASQTPPPPPTPKHGKDDDGDHHQGTTTTTATTTTTHS